MQNANVFAEQWAHIVSASVAPVVVISACALMSLAFYNRLAAIISRLRGFQRERIAEQDYVRRLEREEAPQEYALLRRRRVLANLAEQTRSTLRRARLIRFTLICLLGTTALLVLSSIFNGLAVVWPDAYVGAAILFLSGMLLLLVGIGCALAELLSALDVAESETRLVAELDGLSQAVSVLDESAAELPLWRGP
jgi:hypothetical protein